MPGHRLLRTIAAACLIVSAMWVAPSPAAALEPYRPLPGYRPTFVTETDTRPWKDCLWASAAMLLDKWTNGAREVDRQRLRRLSGDMRGGSAFDDLKKAYGKVGLNLKYSPDGGAPLTWNGLLRRLRAGAGAIILGDDHQLPRWYGRWDYGFWKAKGKKDNHAVYVERYDRRHHRVWLMDPLGRDGWKGEWISVGALKRFAWFSGGRVYAAVSPTAKAAPFAGVRLGTPKVALSGTRLAASWDARTPSRWRLPAVDLRASFTVAADPLGAAVLALDIGTLPKGGQAPARTSIAFAHRSLQVTAPLPERPGAYLAALSFTERRFGRQVASVEDVPVFVPGPRSAHVRIDAPKRALVAGDALKVSLNVANTGDTTWAEDIVDKGAPTEAGLRSTRAIGYWIPVSIDAAADGTVPEPVAIKPAELRMVPLAPDRLLRARVKVIAPEQPGRWAFVVDVMDDIEGSFAALGSRPAALVFDVVPKRGIAPAR